MKKRGSWDLDENEAIKLAILTLQTVIGQQFKSNDIQIGIATKQNPKFGKLGADKVEYFLNEVSKKDIYILKYNYRKDSIIYMYRIENSLINIRANADRHFIILL